MKKEIRPWTERELRVVRDCWAAGDSAGVIAQQLPGRTKSAIIGMANRQGWKRANGRRLPDHFVSRPRRAQAMLRQILTVSANEAAPITLAGPLWSLPAGCRHAGAMG
jgi:hypothetical protein